MAVAATLLGWLVVVYPQRPGPGHGAAQPLQMPAGLDASGVAERLASAGLIQRPAVFALYLRAMGASERLRVGTVMLRDDMTPRTLLRRIASGYGPSELRITIPEGLTRFEIAELLARWGICGARDFIDASADAEGMLFPDTYQLRDDSRAAAVVTRLRDNGRRRLASLRQTHAGAFEHLAASLGWGQAEVVTLASIVEEEAATGDEAPIIAGVFLNRLRDPNFKPRRLQADPTVAYGCRVLPQLDPCTGFDGRRVTRRMTGDAANPYNTYRHDGLPPGPISNPGMRAIRAVLSPAEHGYYYFVAKGAGRHAFSATLEQHLAAVQRYRGGERPRLQPPPVVASPAAN